MGTAGTAGTAYTFAGTSDLSCHAIKFARRMQALDSGQAYSITLFKLDGEWRFTVGKGEKIEKA